MSKTGNKYADFLHDKESQLADRLSNAGENIDKKTMLWLCYAFAGIALFMAVMYIIIFAKSIAA